MLSLQTNSLSAIAISAASNLLLSLSSASKEGRSTPLQKTSPKQVRTMTRTSAHCSAWSNAWLNSDNTFAFRDCCKCVVVGVILK
uniref:Putative secreted protein n=1 Tax=Panstrongylus lignarius TaxID=156445 RepID=A0A224XW37_9HEMI